MLPYLKEHYGNPSSPHGMARAPALAVKKARDQVAGLLCVPSSSLVFTSGGTESNAMAIHAALAARPDRKEIVFSAVEHAAVWGWRARLERQGHTIKIAPVNRDGALDLDQLASLITERTALVCLMLANNETGVIYPVHEVAKLTRKVGAWLHTDAVQAAGKIPFQGGDIQVMSAAPAAVGGSAGAVTNCMSPLGAGVDSAAICGHKFHAIKGIGAMYIREAAGFSPLMLGGEQEGGLRPGTEAVPSIVSLGAAAAEAAKWLKSGESDTMLVRRDGFEDWLLETFPDTIIAGKHQPRLPNTTLAIFPGIDTEPLLALLDMAGVACSSGSACASGAHEPSHVLAAMGLDQPQPAAVVRISSSRFTTVEDYTRLREALRNAVAKLRAATR
jgi:cysteine desulfurase